MASRLKEKYDKEIAPKLQEELGIKNRMALPKVIKVTVSVGAGEAKDNAVMLEGIVSNLAALAGQKPVVTRAKKSISNFKLSKGQAVGASATLRGERMYEFLDKLVSVVLPKVRDFRGLSDTSFDGQGNYTLGLREQSIFPEVSFQTAAPGGKVRGLEISVVTTAKNRDQGKKLLELLGVPFRKEERGRI